MNKKKVVRLELLVLAAVTLLLAYRALEGPPAPEGIAVHSKLRVENVVHHAFSMNGPVPVSIDAVGSFPSANTRDELAAYGWIVHRETRDIVWKMDPNRALAQKGTLAAVSDSIMLAPGTYDVFFTSYGNESTTRFGGIDFLERIFGRATEWRNDESKWKMIVRTANGKQTPVNKLSGQSAAELAPAGEGLFWSTAPMRSRKQAEYVFRTSAPVKVRVYAIGEIGRTQMDFGWIEDAVSGRRVWEMTRESTLPAGGWEVNRLTRDTLSLPAGIFRTSFVTDARHAYDDWVGNPPYDPAGWGITLFADDPAVIAEFDPWKMHPPIVDISRVGDSERRSAQFVVSAPVQLIAYAVGELSDDSRYDYAWIKNNETQETVWEMTGDRSRPAGGENNRVETAFLQLPPATYTVVYQTDDSHSYERWRHGSPDHPERWGVAIFPMDASIDSTIVRVLGYSQESTDEGEGDHPEVPENAEHPVVPLPPLPGPPLVDLTAVGNEKHASGSFILDAPGHVHVRAIGEVSLSGQYDYGWIENAESGQIVWEMTWQNTHPAGGDDRNRMFDGPVELGAGKYVVHFKTDFNHAFGDFDDRSPVDPQSWGIAVTKP